MKHLPIKTLIASLIFLITWTLFGLAYWLLSTLFFKHPAGEVQFTMVSLFCLIFSIVVSVLGFMEMVENEYQQLIRKK